MSSDLSAIHPSRFYNLPTSPDGPPFPSPFRPPQLQLRSNSPVNAHLDPLLHGKTSTDATKENATPNSPLTRSSTTTSSANASPNQEHALPKGKKLPSKPKPTCKPREDFSGNNIDNLLRAVIEIDPFMVPRSQVSAKWKEVATKVQDQACCLGRDADTLKNKVMTLLSWVEVRPPSVFLHPHQLTAHAERQKDVCAIPAQP
jgi:hypothetical protein